MCPLTFTSVHSAHRLRLHVGVGADNSHGIYFGRFATMLIIYEELWPRDDDEDNERSNAMTETSCTDVTNYDEMMSSERHNDKDTKAHDQKMPFRAET